ncbi:wolframin-like [Amphibalanus amphitrite]|uniref:wolframin-like n=1 Tax=Amphibalanus amphitrite TaxID=1232801 RepID=UPI001C909534|nr:wolframin-like [Amphibalanus amphitrite]XP_043246685.1 wolframin-like [Amphibalanus amphitrite]XP_043246686.1 wolframin-like [Amphibalanus amphitrite]
MAGTVPDGGDSGRRSTRKQWTIHEGPQSSLRRLRSNLAEDGCVESQVVMAKQLLDAPAAPSEAKQNYVQAVYYLTKASEQGNVEATDLLRECFEQSRGINDQNYIDVKNCLDMTQEEKLSRRAARELFSTMADGQDFITTAQLRSRLQRLTSQERRDLEAEPAAADAGEAGDDGDGGGDGAAAAAAPAADTADAPRSVSFLSRVGGEKLSEDSLVAAAANFVNGDLPTINKFLKVSDDETAFQEMSLLEKVMFHPVRSVSYGYHKMIETMSERGNAFLLSLIPTTQLKTILVVFLVSFVDMRMLRFILPVMVLYAALFVMVVSTLQMLQLHEDLGNFRIWSQVMKIIKDDLNTQLAEAKFCWKNLYPYLRFFAAMAAAVTALHYTAASMVLNSEITALAALMTAITFISLSERHQRLAWLSMTLHLVMAGLHLFPTLRPATAASLQLAPGLFLDFSLLAILQLATLGCYATMAAQERWRGTYKVLIPHLASVVWFQMAMLFAGDASTGGVLRAVGTFFGTVFALPIIGGFLLLFPALALGRHLYQAGFLLQAVVTVALLALPFGLAFLRSRHASLTRLVSSYQVVVLALGLLSLLPAVHITYLTAPPPTDAAALPWQQYYNVCHRPALDAATQAQVQHGCQLLEGATVQWQGTVADVRVQSAENKLQSLISFLPVGLQQTLACVYGRPIGDCNAELMDEVGFSRCKTAHAVMTSRCTLRAWNRYQFHIVVHMPTGYLNVSPAEVYLSADNQFQAFGLNLRVGDRLEFRGQLSAGLGTARPQLTLTGLQCLSCHQEIAPILEVTQRDVVNELVSSAGALFNFIASPLLRYDGEPAPPAVDT